MILHFPNLDVFRLALTTGTVPAELSATPVRVARAGDALLVETDTALPRAVVAALRKLGVQTLKKLEEAPIPAASWLEALPLQRERTPTAPGANTPVLLLLPEVLKLPEIVGEMLRLGNDRQSFRYLEHSGDSLALLRVLGPPYYSLLRALEANGQPNAPQALTERTPGVWVELGYSHPLLEQLRPPANHWLLLRASGPWLTLPEAPFQDIYETLELELPRPIATWQETAPTAKIPITMQLAAANTAEAAELWVLRERGLEQLEELASSSDDELLQRLAFAVAATAGRTSIILRTRTSRQAPPVLVLSGVAMRPYLKIPNLYLPLGKRLQPPLRREAVRRLLAQDGMVSWLYPEADGSFTPEAIAETAFRPVAQWIDYILAQERNVLASWVEATTFDFDSFLSKEEAKAAAKQRESSSRTSSTRSEGSGVAPPELPAATSQTEPSAPLPDLLLNAAAVEPSALQKQQLDLERQFLQEEGQLDTPQRLVLWPQLATVYTAQGNFSDAILCWSYLFWREPPELPAWLRGWFHALLRAQDGTTLADKLAAALQRTDLQSNDVRFVACAVLQASTVPIPEPAVVQRLAELLRYLAAHEALLPVRMVWLTAVAAARLAHGDVLGLTRTRDRLLERLYRNGLTLDQDFPSFLRFSTSGSNPRFRAFRDWLQALPGKIQGWLQHVHREGLDATPTDTGAYAELMLAYSLARMGETDQARALHAKARAVLSGRDDVHTVLMEAFGHRIEQVLQGQPATGPLPTHQLEYIAQMERIPRYTIDRLRQHSRILEPHEKINPFRHWRHYMASDLGRAIADLADINEPKLLEQRLRDLLARHAGKAAPVTQRATLLRAALEYAPRIGEAFAKEILPQVSATCEVLEVVLEQALLLEKGLAVAAHFNQTTHVHALVQLFEKLLAPGVAWSADTLDTLAGQCFRGLRQLGMREEILRLLGRLAAATQAGQSLDSLRQSNSWGAILRSLLHVAAGWFYFGSNEQARPLLEEARTLLYQGSLSPQEQIRLACVYAATLGQAPTELALQAIDELLTRLPRIYDNFTTRTHYSLSQLTVIEAVLLAVVSEDFARGDAARRWLDDEESLVRQRMHADLQQALGV